jgi:hypothetical protein|tara:strand:- start:372 stop:584 length:213 start_codon:yes stop_codon:yes gene_type:complete
MGWKETVKGSECGHCQKFVKDHSHNQILKCFYTNELNLYNAIQHINKLEKEIIELKDKVSEDKEEIVENV